MTQTESVAGRLSQLGLSGSIKVMEPLREDPPVKGLLCGIYRPVGGGSSNGGISSRVDRVVLISPLVAGVHTPTDAAPAVRLDHMGGYLFAVPIHDPPAGHTGWMFGGTFIYTSDGRFSRVHPLAASGAPIPLHDRTESAELCGLLSR